MAWGRAAIAAGLVLLSGSTAIAQQEPAGEPAADARQTAPAAHPDTRAQYPAFLANSYFSVSVGYLDYAFSDRQLAPGFQAASISVPHAAARVAIFGHEFGRHVAAQLTVMRPVRYVTYTDVNGDQSHHHVWANYGGVTLLGRLPIGARTSLFGEAGIGITSRHGFPRDTTHRAVSDTDYASVLAGAGVERRVSPTWDLTAGVTYSPGSTSAAEPRALMAAGGFRYTMRPLSAEQVEASERAGFSFPANLLQVEYSTGYGYAINTFLSERVPVFWAGTVKVDRGLAVHYDRNVFHTRKIFSLDFGASVSSLRSRTDHDAFVAVSAYPLLRFTFLRTRPADAYFCYSLAGPTYISSRMLDGLDTGKRFTFQDFMGAGLFLGAHRRVAAGIKINHYSNGNIFTENAGVKIPLTITLGYVF